MRGSSIGESPPRFVAIYASQPLLSNANVFLIDGHGVAREVMLYDPELYARITTDGTVGSVRPGHQNLPFYDEKTGISRNWLDTNGRLTEVASRYVQSVELQNGRALILDNHRFLHCASKSGFEEVSGIPQSKGSKRKFILFDIDGTLCTSKGLSFDWACLSRLAGTNITPENTELSETAETDLSHVRHIFEFHGLVGGVIQVQTQAYFKEAESIQGWVSTQCEGVIDALNGIGDTEGELECLVTVGVWTGNSKANAITKLDAAFIPQSYFDMGISSFGDEGPTKLSLFQVSRRKMERTYENLQVDSRDIMIVGDTPFDIQAANDVGCRAVAVTTGGYGVENLQAMNPHIVVSNLREAQALFKEFISGGLLNREV
jgi:phosphoglycolate phosphatase-like HAD superfamily hydrolase